MIQMREYQREVLTRMHNGCILVGGMGTGKSRTAIAYYYILMGGDLNSKNYTPMRDDLKDLYIITTALKRDKLEWEAEMGHFLMSKNDDGMYKHKVVIDSWNNISKYKDVENAFFIFDEQRVVGYGTWAKSFIKIARANQWILLSATPGDKWEDYIPVFIANGFYKHKSDFLRQHVIYKWMANGKFPVVDRYIGLGKLVGYRNKVLVKMKGETPALRHDETITVGYDIWKYKDICKRRWNTWTDTPIENASEFCQCLRRVVNSDPSREVACLEVLEKHPKAIIFYNYNFELEILRDMGFNNGFAVAEWNGHKHQEIPEAEKWIYLVQYTAGSEGWNCLKTDTIIFWSMNYSYKTMVQASGRVDRMNSPFLDLYFYYFKSTSSIDAAIGRALKAKKKFNEGDFWR